MKKTARELCVKVPRIERREQMTIDCPICKEIYKRKDEMILVETWESLLGEGIWLRFFCEWCGASLEVKVAKEIAEEVIINASRDG